MAFPKEELDELRRLHEAATPGKWHYDDGVTDGEGTADAERGKPAWITAKGNVLVAEPSGSDSQEACVPTLAQMDANGRFIEKSHNTLPRLLAALEESRAERDAAETQAWDALGRPEGTHDTTNVQRLCEAHGEIKAKLADPRRVLLHETEVVATKDEITGLKAKLAKAQDIMETWFVDGDDEKVVMELYNALAAAKVQP